MKTTTTVSEKVEKAATLSLRCPCCNAPTVALKRGSAIRHCIMSRIDGSCRGTIRVVK